ncbi:MAG TPA: DUF418 domain-containing protein [Allosphingosinicella sp.]|nr:DUF418 domain-containing protein [Allosphingosinicella sp.]
MSSHHGSEASADGGFESTAASGRIATLDIIRGVAVMGILAMNIVAFAMPVQAYVNPRAYGWDGAADLWSWLVSFVFIDGRMRGLFSFLFGASMLLIIERADAQGQPSARIHFKRMAWLLLFGLAHFYFIWSGDILSLYAPIGMLAWFFHHERPRNLLLWGALLILAEALVMASLAASAASASAAAALPRASAEALKAWRDLGGEFAVPSSGERAAILALYRGGYGGILMHRLTAEGADPVMNLLTYGCETLGYMLLGMAALRNGFLAGRWSNRRYALVAAGGFLITVPLYALLAWILIRHDFSVPELFAYSLFATTPLRPVMIVAIAALVVLATRGGGALVERIAAAGRTAFTNYLATSIVMTSLFYGYGAGLFGTMSRAQLWLAVVPMWALMLLWSRPWLDRFRYGPFEWLWRSLARGAPQPMRISKSATQGSG